jgi:hypothetical protein
MGKGVVKLSVSMLAGVLKFPENYKSTFVSYDHVHEVVSVVVESDEIPDKEIDSFDVLSWLSQLPEIRPHYQAVLKEQSKEVTVTHMEISEPAHE